MWRTAFAIPIAVIAFLTAARTGGFEPIAAPPAPPETVSVSPAAVLEGDPALVRIGGADLAAVTGVSFGGETLPLFAYASAPAAFIAVGIHAATGTETIEARFIDGHIATASLAVLPRRTFAEPLPVPAQLGGNSVANQAKLASTLGEENALLASLPSATSSLWHPPFVFPVPDHTITDPYGYSRDSGAYDIVHLGTDFRAPVGTPVSAINAGVVTLARVLPDYGGTVVIDHGLGLESYYMHLSQIGVTVGQTVSTGQTIGLSGATGYASGPHLHLSVHIGGVAIDPIKFFDLIEQK